MSRLYVGCLVIMVAHLHGLRFWPFCVNFPLPPSSLATRTGQAALDLHPSPAGATLELAMGIKALSTVFPRLCLCCRVQW